MCGHQDHSSISTKAFHMQSLCEYITKPSLFSAFPIKAVPARHDACIASRSISDDGVCGGEAGGDVVVERETGGDGFSAISTGCSFNDAKKHNLQKVSIVPDCARVIMRKIYGFLVNDNGEKGHIMRAMPSSCLNILPSKK